MTGERLQELLDHTEVDYQAMSHPEAFTAQETAAASHVAGWDIAKAVVLRDDSGRFLIAVLPAPCRVDLRRLERASQSRELRLATECEMKSLVPDCQEGAVPPFGRLYGVPTFLDACVPRAGRIFFSAGTHHELVSLLHDDFLDLARPMLAEFCAHAPGLGGQASAARSRRSFE